MRWLIILSSLLLIGLQLRLWSGEGSYVHLWQTEHEITAQEAENQRLRQRNRVLANEVIELQSGLETVEEVARQELGLIRSDETFYLITEPGESN